MCVVGGDGEKKEDYQKLAKTGLARRLDLLQTHLSVVADPLGCRLSFAGKRRAAEISRPPLPLKPYVVYVEPVLKQWRVSGGIPLL